MTRQFLILLMDKNVLCAVIFFFTNQINATFRALIVTHISKDITFGYMKSKYNTCSKNVFYMKMFRNNLHESGTIMTKKLRLLVSSWALVSHFSIFPIQEDTQLVFIIIFMFRYLVLLKLAL
jgi:hypothetical protein